MIPQRRNLQQTAGETAGFSVTNTFDTSSGDYSFQGLQCIDSACETSTSPFMLELSTNEIFTAVTVSSGKAIFISWSHNTSSANGITADKIFTTNFEISEYVHSMTERGDGKAIYMLIGQE